MNTKRSLRPERSITFFLGNNDFCLLPHPNRRAGKSLPEILWNRERFSVMGEESTRRIFLPATQKFPWGAQILIERASNSWDEFPRRERRSLEGEMQVRKTHVPSGREHFSAQLDEITEEFLIEQARARVGSKLLPGYELESISYQGELKGGTNEAVVVLVECQYICGAPGMNGSYVRFSYWRDQQESMSWVADHLALLIGDRNAKFHLNSFDDVVRHSNLRFPWMWKQSASR